MPKLLFVSGTSDPRKVAGAIAHALRAAESVILRAMGPDAVNQGVKSAAIARTYLRGDGYDIHMQPNMVNLQMNGSEKSAIEMFLHRV